MSEIPKVLDHMLAAWNERATEKVRSHLERAVSPDVHFVDPGNDVRGIEAFEKMVHEFRAKFPEAICSRASEVDLHNRVARYHWAIHSDGKLLIPGFDVVEFDEAGRVVYVVGFFGLLEVNARQSALSRRGSSPFGGQRVSGARYARQFRRAP